MENMAQTYTHMIGTGYDIVGDSDFSDRGPEQGQVLCIARAMWEAGDASAVTGSHEFNAIRWAAKRRSLLLREFIALTLMSVSMSYIGESTF
jgi:hypothetical protein